MITLLAFLVAIGLLVTFHELGHYWVARLAGVKVLRFSIGFGKPLFTWRRGETEWTLCPIPLGGYVRMLDEREGPVDAADLPRAFNTQPVGKRIAIVAAGPLANLVLAVLLYWVVLAQGQDWIRPWVGSVTPQSPAAVAGFQPGDKLLRVDGEPVGDWQGLRLELMQALAARDRVEVAVETAAGAPARRVIDLARLAPQERERVIGGQLGLSPIRVLPVIGGIEAGGAAERAGLKIGDKLLSADGRRLASWEDWVATVSNSPGREIRVGVERAGKPLALTVRPDSRESDAGLVGRIGAAPTVDAAWRDAVRQTRELSVGEAALAAVAKTWETTTVSLKLLGWMVVGNVSWGNLSGPLTIASVAGQTAEQGWDAYLEFLALISVSIGILNLLPIPVLDGGHLMYYVAELIKGKPVSEKTQIIGQKIGLMLLGALMMFALFNDLSRLFGG
ncbi:regulator of sigma E protease [Crenobacter luteus]|uniref:RIP metalloprotease RseP n=1 Tax=Crenobacter luteus TaxID=1452487 RepID=UPI00104E562C|nr:RIP metalloprotease RseP [Crenobacter luteus]TCP12146.1 regulator of sigma E protease [Crenobacter luteus]